MPDTGAPWNIPYVAGTDLVADWPTDSQTLAEAIADGLDLVNVFPIVSSVNQTADTNLTTTSWVDLSGVSITVTPRSDTSKFYLAFIGYYGHSGTTQGQCRIVRDSTTIKTGSLIPGFSSTVNKVNGGLADIDAPATASAITYKVQGTLAAASGSGQWSNGNLLIIEHP